ncbi:MAG: iron complex outermembrane receptor protein, partial [Psychrobacter glaciei]
FSYQLDNPDLEKETAYTLDVTWQYFSQDYQLDAAAYYYDFDGYIYNQLLSVVDPFHGNDVYQFIQEDAYITGFELSGQYQLTQLLMATASLDKVTGRLKAGSNKNLPRTPPMSALLGLAWQQNAWLAKANIRFYAKQDQVGENEQATDSYETLNIFVGYEFAFNDVELDVHLKGNNLTDELGRNHVSYLKEISPVAGRNFSLDMRLSF